MIKFLISFILFLNITSKEGISAEERPTIIYVNDPLCSWCYGFAPEATRIREKYKEVADFRLVEGGLRPDATTPMSSEQKTFMRTHWEEIRELTGQPFNFAILDSEDFVYNTEVPCRAVVTVRKLKPEVTFDFMKAIQHTFYAGNRNTNKLETYLELLPRFDIDEKEFTSLFQSEEIKTETRNDFELSDAAGISGFPAILIKKGGKLKVITKGYDSFSKLEKKMDKELLAH